MIDIRTKAMALAALENEVLIWWDELHDRYVAALDNRKVALSDEIDISLVELYAKAAEALGLVPDQALMTLLKACEAALIGAKHEACGYESPDSTWHCCDWNEVVKMLEHAIAKAHGKGDTG